MAQAPWASQAETQNEPAAGKSGWAAQALPAPHSLSLWQGWQKGVMALQVRTAVLQYWPLAQELFEVQPPTVSTHCPVKALQNLPGQAASLVQTQRRISRSQRKLDAHSESPEQVPGNAKGKGGTVLLQAASARASAVKAHLLNIRYAYRALLRGVNPEIRGHHTQLGLRRVLA